MRFLAIVGLLILTFVPLAAHGAELAGTNATLAATIVRDLKYESHYRAKLQTATVLIVISLEDKRPFYLEEALLVLKYSKGKWLLVHAVRHPKPSPVIRDFSPEWQIFDVRDAPWPGDFQFDHSPTSEEVDRFIRDSRFQFKDDALTRVTRIVIDPGTWERVLGYPPSRVPAVENVSPLPPQK